MILQEYLEVKPIGKVKYYYENLGYKLNGKKPIQVKNQDLPKSSTVIEKRQCDVKECCKIFSRPHENMVINFNKYGIDLCPECAEKERLKRIKETNLKKYGVTNPMKSKEVQEKAKQTTLEHYGVEYPTQNKDIVALRASNFLKEHGVENPQQVSEIQAKTQQTNLERYGSENPFGSKEIQEKIRQTNLKEYGVENPSQSEIIRSKTEKTCLKKYGTKSPLQNNTVKAKIKDALIESYGVDSPLKSVEIREKFKQTMLERFGVENAMQSEELKKKLRDTFTKNGTVPTSKPQIELFNLCQKWFSKYSVKLNFPLSFLSLDIVLETPEGLKIDLEYDGWYWHKNSKKKDYARDCFVKTQGYKVIRIKSNTLLPTKKQLVESIEYISQKEHSFTQIILQDWKDLEDK